MRKFSDNTNFLRFIIHCFVNGMYLYRNNFLDVRIFIEELSYNSVKQTPAYSIASLQSKILQFLVSYNINKLKYNLKDMVRPNSGCLP